MGEKTKPELLYLSCGSRDDKRISSWFLKAKESGTNIGNLISQAVEYYEETGRYYCLGKIHEPEGKTVSRRTSIYVNKKSKFYKIIEKLKSEDVNISRYLKTIIYNGVIYTEEKEYIPSQYEKLKDLSEMEDECISNAMSNVIEAVSHNKVSEIVNEPVSELVNVADSIKKKNKNSLAMELLKSDIANGFGLGK